jgi:CHAD domain-containing protein/CYTH domain-containing protein
VTPRPSLLQLPAPRAARLLALGFLRDAAAAHRRLSDPGDGEALHDFRVSLRRLRATLEEHRGVLEGVRKRHRQAVGRLLQSTGSARDAQVHAAAFAALRGRLGGGERAGADGILRRLAEAGEGKADATAAEKAFPRIRRRLEKRLATLTVAVEEEPGDATPFAAVLADRVERAAGKAAARVGRACEEVDPVSVHRARLAVKRLRYLVEPFAPELDGGAGLVALLRAMQDRMGALRDGWLAVQRVAAAAGPAPMSNGDGRDGDGYGEADSAVASGDEEETAAGLRALVARLGEEQRAAADELRRRCSAGEVDAARALAARVVDDARAKCKGNIEIERKYLLRCFPTLPAGATSVSIAQGWIRGERLHERIRRVRYEDGAERWFRTVKLGSGVARVEVEEEAPAWLGRRLWLLTRGRRVRKRRWSVPHGGLVWEIDRFAGRTLVLAEVELPRADHPVEIPGWLGPCLDREVTGEAAYVNLNLAR